MKALAVSSMVIATALIGSFVAGLAIKSQNPAQDAANPPLKRYAGWHLFGHHRHPQISTDAINSSLLLGNPYSPALSTDQAHAPLLVGTNANLHEQVQEDHYPPPSANSKPLAELLMAEFEVQRDNPNQAIQRYLRLADQLNDIELIERAAAISYASTTDYASDIASMWARLAPPGKAADVPILAAQMNAAAQQQKWVTALSKGLSLCSKGQTPDLIALVSQAANRQGPLTRLGTLLTRYSRRHPQQPLPQMALAIVQARSGHAARANASIARVKRGWPDLAVAWLVDAQLALIQNHPTNALQALEHGHQLEPDDPRFLLAMAQVLLQLQRPHAAFTKASALIQSQLPQKDSQPQSYGDASALVNASIELFLHYQQPALALKLLSPLKATPLANADTHLLLASAYQATGDWQQASRIYQSVPANSDAYPDAIQAAAELLLNHQNGQAALDMLIQQREAHPQQWAALTQLSVALLDHLQRSADADTLLNDAIAHQSPDNNDLLLMRVYREIDRQDITSAEADLKVLLQRLPDDPEVLNTYGYTLSEYTQRSQQALGMLQKAYQLAPGDGAIMDSLGWTYAKLGQLDKAAALLKKADAIQLNDEVSAHLLSVLVRLGQHAQAKRLWQQRIKQLHHHPQLDRLADQQGWLKASQNPSPALPAKGVASR